MVRVKREYYLPGARYSLNKEAIKATFKKYDLKWKGTFEFPRWMSTSDSIVAEFLRENEVTVGAKLKFDGDPLGEFCIEFTKLMDGLGAEYDDAEVVSQEQIDSEVEAELEEKIKEWERAHRPNVELMRRGTIHNGYKPVPEAFLNAALRDFKEKRDAEYERLKGLRMGVTEPAKGVIDSGLLPASDEPKEKPKRGAKKKLKETADDLTDDTIEVPNDWKKECLVDLS